MPAREAPTLTIDLYKTDAEITNFIHLNLIDTHLVDVMTKEEVDEEYLAHIIELCVLFEYNWGNLIFTMQKRDPEQRFTGYAWWAFINGIINNQINSRPPASVYKYLAPSAKFSDFNGLMSKFAVGHLFKLCQYYDIVNKRVDLVKEDGQGGPGKNSGQGKKDNQGKSGGQGKKDNQETREKVNQILGAIMGVFKVDELNSIYRCVRSLYLNAPKKTRDIIKEVAKERFIGDYAPIMGLLSNCYSTRFS